MSRFHCPEPPEEQAATVLCEQAATALCEQAEIIHPLGRDLSLSRIAWHGMISICSTHRILPAAFANIAATVNPDLDKNSAIELLVLAFLRADTPGAA